MIILIMIIGLLMCLVHSVVQFIAHTTGEETSFLAYATEIIIAAICVAIIMGEV